jgi:hypothetical protein
MHIERPPFSLRTNPRTARSVKSAIAERYTAEAFFYELFYNLVEEVPSYLEFARNSLTN